MIKKFLNFFLNLLFPSRCIYCEGIISPDKNICSKCKSEIDATKPTLTKLILDNHTEVLCYSALFYGGNFKRAMINFKFHERKNLSPYFADVVSKMITDNLNLDEFDCITSVPISNQRKKERGYNQSELIALDVCKKVNLPYKNLLIKIKNNLPQHTLSRNDRKTNVLGVYKALNNNDIQGNRILLFDDILTTGNTLKECSKTLYSAGATNVVCITFL